MHGGCWRALLPPMPAFLLARFCVGLVLLPWMMGVAEGNSFSLSSSSVPSFCLLLLNVPETLVWGLGVVPEDGSFRAKLRSF